MDGAAFDAIIVGAGIGGTAFALAAAREGWRVAILEREPAPRVLPRPEILWPASLRFLDALGAGEEVREDAAVRLRGVEVRDEDADRVLLRYREADFMAAGVQPYATDPTTTRALLLKAAQATGNVTHVAGAEVTGLLNEGGRVRGVEGTRAGERVAYRAPFVAGDDGVRSVTRASASIGMDAAPFPVEFLLTTGKPPIGLRAGEARACLRSRGFRGDILGVLFVPVHRERVACVIAVRPGAFPALAAEPEAFEERVAWAAPPYVFFGRDHAFPRDFVHAVRTVGHAHAYWKPGIALLGDAAHPVSPAGGQGANMALADAAALARTVLPRTTPGEAPEPATLAAYEAVRRPGNARSVHLSLRVARMLRACWRHPGLATWMPFAAKRLNASRPRKARFITRVSRAFVDG